jgi:dTDP-4-amino-4,6-dideoxygalactose transaminase
MCQAYLVENADIVYQKALSLPSSVGIKDEDIERVVDVIRVYSQ